MSINWPIIIVCAVGISLLLTVLIIPQVLQVSLMKRLFDRPDNRKVHKGIVPRLGGFAFLPAIIMTLGIMLVIPASRTDGGTLLGTEDFIAALPEVTVLLAAMTILFMTGLYDDLLGMKYWMKLIFQIIAAVLIVEGGEFITGYNDLFGVIHTSQAAGKIITGFLILYIINAINLIDGIDGLASGLCTVALCFFGTALYLESLYIYSLLSWVGAGSMTAFWLFNVFGSQKRHTKIFMGDIGALTMGLLTAFLAIAVGREPVHLSAWGAKPIILMLSPMVIPLLDVIRVFCVRVIRGRSPFEADKNHIHHQMLGTGMRMKTVMASLIIAQIGFLALNLWLSFFVGINTLLIIDAVVYTGGVLIINSNK